MESLTQKVSELLDKAEELSERDLDTSLDESEKAPLKLIEAHKLLSECSQLARINSDWIKACQDYEKRVPNLLFKIDCQEPEGFFENYFGDINAEARLYKPLSGFNKQDFKYEDIMSGNL